MVMVVTTTAYLRVRMPCLGSGPTKGSLCLSAAFNLRQLPKDMPPGQFSADTPLLETPLQVVLGCVKLTVKANHHPHGGGDGPVASARLPHPHREGTCQNSVQFSRAQAA